MAAASASVRAQKQMEREHDASRSRVSRRAPAFAIGGEQLLHLAAGERDRHHSVPRPSGVDERLRRAERGHPERRARSLRRARQRGDVLEAVEAPFDRDVLLFEQATHLLDAFVEARAALVDTASEPRELVRQERAREPDFESSARDRVEHADLAGELERMVEHRQHRAGDQARASRPLGGGGEEDDRVRAVAAVLVEVVLDGADVGESQRVAQGDQVETLGEVAVRRLGVGADVGEELNPELHGGGAA